MLYNPSNFKGINQSSSLISNMNPIFDAFYVERCFFDPSRPRLTPRPPFPASREGKKCHDLKIGLANRYGGPPFPLKNGRELEGWVQIDAL